MSLNDKATAALTRELAKCFPERPANDPGHARLAAALSDTAHTPGPWIVCEGDLESQIVFIEQDRECLIHEEPSTIGEIDLSGEGIDEITGLANARLIAAAPELLEACKEQAKHIGELNRLTRSIELRVHPDARNLVAALVSVIRLAEIHADNARAAIAKAEGGK